MIEGIVKIFRLFPLWALLAAGYWWMQWVEFKQRELDPQTTEITANTKIITNLERNLKTLESKITQIPELTQTYRNLSSQLDVKLSKLPRDFNNAQILRQMTDIGKRSSLDFNSFEIEDEKMKNFYSKMNIRMKLRGAFPQILLFFDRLARADRIYNINNIEFSGQKRVNKKFVSDVTAVATTFRYREESGFGK